MGDAFEILLSVDSSFDEFDDTWQLSWQICCGHPTVSLGNMVPKFAIGSQSVFSYNFGDIATFSWIPASWVCFLGLVLFALSLQFSSLYSLFDMQFFIAALVSMTATQFII